MHLLYMLITLTCARGYSFGSPSSTDKGPSIGALCPLGKPADSAFRVVVVVVVVGILG